VKGKGEPKSDNRGGEERRGNEGEGESFSVPFAPLFHLSFSLALLIQLSLFGSPFALHRLSFPFAFPFPFAVRWTTKESAKKRS
jgi:hypothetical protein